MFRADEIPVACRCKRIDPICLSQLEGLRKQADMPIGDLRNITVRLFGVPAQSRQKLCTFEITA